MIVRLFEENIKDAEAWDNYVHRSSETTTDHLWAWRRILRGAFGFKPYYLAAIDETDEVVGILPLFRVQRNFGQCALSSIPFGNYGGVCADSKEISDLLLRSAKELLFRIKGTYLELRHRSPVSDESLHEKNLYHRFRFPLNGDPQKHFREIGRNNRAKINKATQKGARVIISRDVNKMYPVHAHTARRLGTPCFPRRYFELVLESFPDSSEIFFVMIDGRPVAYDFMLIFKKSLVCQFKGGLESFFSYRPNHLLFWHAVEIGCGRGYKEFDYCRSRKDSGTAYFKRSLHMVEEPLNYQYFMTNGEPLPQRHPSNPKYQWAIRLWQRLPLTLTELMGPMLVRYLA